MSLINSENLSSEAVQTINEVRKRGRGPTSLSFPEEQLAAKLEKHRDGKVTIPKFENYENLAVPQGKELNTEIKSWGNNVPNGQETQDAKNTRSLDMIYNLRPQPPASKSDYLEGKKIAPRSSDLFRIGPDFSPTFIHQNIYCRTNETEVIPVLNSRIDRGFELGEEGTWVGYKRNYFSLVSSFNMKDYSFDKFVDHKFFIKTKSLNSDGDESNEPSWDHEKDVGKDTTKQTDINEDDNLNNHGNEDIEEDESIPPSKKRKHIRGKPKRKDEEVKMDISYFAIRLVAKCNDDDFNVTLVQHTAKRDKGPQFPPPIYPVIIGDLPSHDIVKSSTNKRNDNKIGGYNKLFMFDRGEYYGSKHLDIMNDRSILKNYPSELIAKVARFERIQFGSSIRMKNSTKNNRYYSLSVELLGIIEEGNTIQPILLASSDSPPLIIRGRSPSNYHKNKTSGYRGSDDH